MQLKATIQKLSGIFRKLIFISGGIAIFVLAFSFTTGPFWMYYWLGTSKSSFYFEPKHIIVLGGGGMPSESGLIRIYYASALAKSCSDADIIIALPVDSGISFINSDVYRMKQELMQHDVDPLRISLETTSHNTREQALNILKMKSEFKTEPCLIVTSPEHMRRAVMTFRKTGFKKIGGIPAFEKAIDSKLGFTEKKLGGRNLPLPEIGNNIQIRYQFWNHLKYQVICYREFLAISYYWLKGWI